MCIKRVGLDWHKLARALFGTAKLCCVALIGTVHSTLRLQQCVTSRTPASAKIEMCLAPPPATRPLSDRLRSCALSCSGHRQASWPIAERADKALPTQQARQLACSPRQLVHFLRPRFSNLDPNEKMMHRALKNVKGVDNLRLTKRIDAYCCCCYQRSNQECSSSD